MTTPAAEAQYQRQHLHEMEGKDWAVYNPYNYPPESLPVIYGYNNGGGEGWWHAQLLAEDGTALGSHICSHELYMPHDLGILEGTRPDRHEAFREHFPAGYRMVFVGGNNPYEHEGIKEAYRLNQEKAAEANKEEKQ